MLLREGQFRMHNRQQTIPLDRQLQQCWPLRLGCVTAMLLPLLLLLLLLASAAVCCADLCQHVAAGCGLGKDAL